MPTRSLTSCSPPSAPPRTRPSTRNWSPRNSAPWSRTRPWPWCCGTRSRSTAATRAPTSSSPPVPRPSSRAPGRPAGSQAMGRYVAQRIGQALLVVWLAYTVIFLAVQLLPGDPVTIFLSTDAAVDQATIDNMKRQYGYDQPLLVQYFAQL